MENGRTLRVAFYDFPQSWENPYPRLLTQALKDAGIEVSFIRLLSAEPIETDNAAPDLVDLQWPEYEYHRGRSIFSTLRAAHRFFKNVRKLKQRGIKLFWTLHNLQPHHAIPVFDWACYALLARRADVLLVFSEWEKKAVAKKFFVRREKIKIISHGNYVDCYHTKFSREEARQKLGIDRDKFVFMYFGLIRENKGVFALIEAFRKMARANEVLLVAGKPLTEKITRRLQAVKDPNILLFPKRIDDENVADFFNAADACVFPFSKVANSGSVMLGMSMGKPILCGAKGSLVEIVKPDFGLFFKDGRLADGLVDFRMKDCAKMGQAALSEAKKYDWQRIGQDYRKIYSEALKP